MMASDETSGRVSSGTSILYKEESYAIQGAIFEVYRVMGCGFLEAVYQECLQLEFALRGIPFEAQVHNYLSATGLKLGLLVNFGRYPKAKVERIVL
jgi:hypothetical protein